MQNSSNLKSLFSEVLSIHDYINLKSKVKILDCHSSLPWIAFVDAEHNILVFDAIEKKPIRAFHLGEAIKNIKFFNTRDKHYINNYDLNEIKKIKGVPFTQRSHLLILVLEKSIVFYSVVNQTIVKTITIGEMENKQPLKCEVVNFMYAAILTIDGSLIIWNLLDWTLVRSINKNVLGKTVSNFTVITNKCEESYIVLANSSGNILLVDIMKKDIIYTKLDDKSEHESNILAFDYNPYSNLLTSISKTAIYIVDISNIKYSKKLPIFQYHKSEKPYGIISNLNHNFTKNTYFIYGKTSVLSCLELKLKVLKSRKIDSKEMKTYIYYNFDLDGQQLPKNSDKQFKIYTAVFLNHTEDYLVFGTNKGLVISRFSSVYKPDVTILPELSEIQSKYILFYIKDSLVESTIESESKVTKREISKEIFDNKAQANNFFERYSIKFSYDMSHIALIDITSNIYSVHSLYLTEDLQYKVKGIKFGKCTGEFEWCPYAPIFAVTTASINQVSSKSAASSDKNRLSNSFRTTFTLNVYSIQGDIITAVYVIDDLPCHKIFGGHYLGIINSLNSVNNENLSFPGTTSNFTYSLPAGLVVHFYHWNEKNKLEFYLSEEPKLIINSADLKFLCVVYQDKYTVYSVISDEYSNDLSLVPYGNFYYKISHAYIYDNFCFVFLTDKGIFFHLLNESDTYPHKLLRVSDQINYHHLKISKKIKEKSSLFPRKLQPQKIVGILGTQIILASSFNNISFANIDHILFKFIDLISHKKLDEAKLLICNVEKKYTKSLISILRHYFENDHQSIKNFFSDMDPVLFNQLQLYKYDNVFVQDYLNSTNVEDRGQVDKNLRHLLMRYLVNQNQEEITNLYNFANKSELYAKY